MFKKLRDAISSTSNEVYDLSVKNLNIITDKSVEIYKDITNIEFSKLISIGSSEKTEFDTMHYFLIPNLNNAEEFTLHTYRELPTKVINENKLTKRKVFHLPSENYFQLLKNKVIEENKNNNINEEDYTGLTSNVLKNVANSIDETNQVMSNGLLIIGAIACIANPIAGIALIGSSFVPSFLSEAITGSLKGISQKLDISSVNQVNKEAEEKAIKELEEVIPTMEVNSVLSKFYKSIKDSDYEANLDLPDDKDLLALTLKVINPVYDPIINDNSFFNKQKINTNIKNYYKVISSF